MGWPRLLVFVRHGESAGNVMSPDDRAAFETPTHAYPLTGRGRQQAEITGAYLKKNFGSFDIVWSSYYERARQTAALVCGGRKVWEDPRLAEGQRGIYHTYTKAEVLAHFPKEIARREREGFYHHRPLGGENWPDIELRIHSFLTTLNRDGEGKRVLIVGHGHWFILFQKLLEHFTIEEAERRYRAATVENASVSVFNGGEGALFEQFVRLTEDKTAYRVPWADQLPKDPRTTAPPA